jgi:FlaA1/EpsC-like NDP-sugar epimerase
MKTTRKRNTKKSKTGRQFDLSKHKLSKRLKRILKYTSPRWLVLLIDLYIVLNTFLLAYFIRFNFSFNFDVAQLFVQLPVVFIAALLAFLLTGSYKGIIRYTGTRDAFNVTIAAFLLLSVLVGVVLFNRNIRVFEAFTIPLSIAVIHFLLNVVILIASRFIYKTLYNLLVTDYNAVTKVLIYGAGEAGILTYNVLKNDKEIDVSVVGFIDDDSSKQGKRIDGVKVYDAAKLNEAFIEKHSIDEIIIAIQTVKSSRLLEIADNLTALPVSVKIVPPAKTWVNGDFSSNQIKEVRIEDLLGRDPIALDNPVLSKEFKNKVVWITGAAGSIGSELARQLANLNCKQLVLIDQAESPLYNLQQYFVQQNIENIAAIVANVRNEKRMELLFASHTPHIIFHAAAYKHVPFMEENPYEAVSVNIGGTGITARLAVQFGVEKFVFISTDKAVNPTNIMGATKRIAEMVVNALNNKNTKFITTRFGNVLGSNGSVIPLFESQIANGGPVTVTHEEITRFFMTIPEACQLVLEAAVMGQGGEIYVFDMGESVKIMDLAKNMIHLKGLRYPQDIDIKITGLRPGEKIYEELLADGEITTKTHHKKIMIAKVKPLEKEVLLEQVGALCRSNAALHYTEVVKQMKKIVPEYKSNNSAFEALD